MLILALDTTTRAGSAALVSDGTVRHELTGDATVTHGQRLPADLMRLLDEAGATLADVDLFAVGAGPGSFTGLRVGIAAIQGLALATGHRVVPVSALDALALAGSDGTHPVAAWMDAQRGEVYAAVYAAGARQAMGPPTSLPPDRTLQALPPAVAAGDLLFVGDGACRYAAVIRSHVGPGPRIRPDVPPLAPAIARLAIARADQAVAPHAIVPIYVRRPDAELARDRRADA